MYIYIYIHRYIVCTIQYVEVRHFGHRPSCWFPHMEHLPRRLCIHLKRLKIKHVRFLDGVVFLKTVGRKSFLTKKMDEEKSKKQTHRFASWGESGPQGLLSLSCEGPPSAVSNESQSWRTNVPERKCRPFNVSIFVGQEAFWPVKLMIWMLITGNGVWFSTAHSRTQ